MMLLASRKEMLIGLILGMVQNFASCLIEVVYSRHMNFATAIGFITAFQICRRLTKEGCLWIGCPCSQWIWISRGTTKRCRLRPSGSRHVASAKEANRLVRRICFLQLGYVWIYLFLFLAFLGDAIVSAKKFKKVGGFDETMFATQQTQNFKLLFLQYLQNAQARVHQTKKLLLDHRTAIKFFAALLQTVGGGIRNHRHGQDCCLMSGA